MSKLLKILLVEDNPADVRLTAEMLKKGGINHALTVAEDGEEAISYLVSLLAEKSACLPDLVLLDLNLPKKNGHEVLQFIRASPSLSNLPVAVITTSENPDHRKAVEHLGVTCFVNKPAHLEDLHLIITAAEQAFLAGASAGQASPAEKELRVLLVEDNQNLARCLVVSLEKRAMSHIKVAWCETLRAALDYLTTAMPDVILLDLGLPDAHGLDSLFKIHRAVPHCPIVVLTGLDDEAVGIEALKSGAQDFLIKGAIGPELLVRSMRYAIERNRAELLAHESIMLEDEILREILEHAPVSVVRLRRDLSIADFNAKFAQQLGVPSSSVRNKSIRDLLPYLPADRLASTLNDGIPLHIENQPIHENRFWELLCWPIRTRDKEAKEAILLALDVTDSTLVQKQRDEFVASLAHEVKMPMLGQGRVLDAMLEGMAGKLSDKQVEVVRALKEDNTSLLLLLQNLLDTYRYEAGTVVMSVERWNINNLVKKQVRLFTPFSVLKGVDIDVKLSESCPDLNVDQAAIDRLLANLLHNAIIYNKRGGRVTVSTKAIDSFVHIEISDTGPGISLDEQARLFSRFSHAAGGHRYRPGVGLGLYLCKRIVEAHRGEITFETTPGAGTTFTVKLPV